MKFYAIRHKPTGFYLPRNKNKAPSEKEVPNLFKYRGTAQSVITFYTGTGDGYGHYYPRSSEVQRGGFVLDCETLEVVEVSLVPT